MLSLYEESWGPIIAFFKSFSANPENKALQVVSADKRIETTGNICVALEMFRCCGEPVTENNWNVNGERQSGHVISDGSKSPQQYNSFIQLTH